MPAETVDTYTFTPARRGFFSSSKKRKKGKTRGGAKKSKPVS